MKDRFLKIHRQVKEWITQVLFRKYLTPFILIVIYFFVLGPTSIFLKIFGRSKLSRSINNSNSNWIETKNYEDSLEESLNQS